MTAGRPWARVVARDGFAVVVLGVDHLEVEVVPELSMVGAAVRWRGQDHVALHRGLGGYASGEWTGVPLLHPWANRLPGDRVPVAGSDVVLDLAEDPRVARDGSGLPMHGTANALDGWIVERLGVDRDGGSAVLRGSLDVGARPELLAGFPFPHRVVVTWTVLTAGHPDGCEGESVVRVTTTVEATADVRVPVSFGWHPYLCLPGVPRARWRLVLPRRRHLELDGRRLPTGGSEWEPAEAAPLGERTFDDAYALADDRTLALRGDGRCTAVTFDEGYPFAQVYAPSDADVVALEPMTAPTGALATGEHPWVEPGSSYSASFTVQVG